MSEYKVTANILFDGAIYKIGETLELTDADASRIKRYLKPTGKQVDTQPQNSEQSSDVDYDEKTTNELKQLVEERNLDVQATGKNGKPVKADYVKALEQVE